MKAETCSCYVILIKFVLYNKVVLGYKFVQGEHKVFPWLQTFITRKLLYVEYKLFFFKM